MPGRAIVVVIPCPEAMGTLLHVFFVFWCPEAWAVGSQYGTICYISLDVAFTMVAYLQDIQKSVQ
jgi:hypothetical protein